MQTEHIAPEAQIPLSSLLAEQRDPSTTLAQSSGQIYTWGDFRLDVASLSSQILEIGIGRWLLFTEDTYLFTVGLFAIWYADSIAVLPHNLGQQTLKELNHDLKGVVTDCKLKHANVPVPVPKVTSTLLIFILLPFEVVGVTCDPITLHTAPSVTFRNTILVEVPGLVVK